MFITCRLKNLVGSGFLQFQLQLCVRTVHLFVSSKETTLERAYFFLQLYMFVTEEKEGAAVPAAGLDVLCLY